MVISPSSTSSRTGADARASTIASATAFVMSSTDRIASSLPAIGTVMRSGSALVSAIAMIGRPSLLASLTAIRSFFESTTNSNPGSRVIERMPLRYFFSLSASRVSISCSFFV